MLRKENRVEGKAVFRRSMKYWRDRDRDRDRDGGGREGRGRERTKL